MKRFLILSAASLFCITRLHADPKADILGKWTDSDTGQVTEYKEHGNIERTLPTGDVLYGRYAFVDDTHIFIHLKSEMMPTAPVITPIAIDGDDMQLLDTDGKKLKKLKREKKAKDGE